jgi:hypothetical protein
MGGLFGGGKKAARITAAATLKSAEMQAANDRLVAQASQNSMETMLAQSVASDKAAELLSVPQGQIDVQLGASTDAPTVDEATGKRRTVRQKYTPTRNKGTQL